MLREKGEESIHRALWQSDELINCCVGAKNITKYMDPVESFRAAKICGDGIMVELVLLQLLSRWSVTQQVTRRVCQATDVKMLSLSFSSVKPQP